MHFYCRAPGCKKPGPYKSQQAYTLHQNRCLAVQTRGLETQRIIGEIRMKETREAEERERAALLTAYMLSNPVLEVRHGSLDGSLLIDTLQFRTRQCQWK